jgi:hypothetical protein
LTGVAQPGRWFPGKKFGFAGGEDESYFANLDMQVSIPAAALRCRLRKDARNKTLSSLMFPGELFPQLKCCIEG